MRTPLSVVILSSALASASAGADWVLDPARSHLAFVSIKANNVAEVHGFREIGGRVDAAGQVRVTLMLDSVDTLIPVRDERMRAMLFDTVNYREAVLDAKIEPQTIDAMAVGTVGALVGEGRLTLHGTTEPLTIEAQAARVGADTLVVASTRPVIVDAAKFGLSEGIEQLRAIAGLESISSAVPVTFVMTFTQSAN